MNPHQSAAGSIRINLPLDESASICGWMNPHQSAAGLNPRQSAAG
jgi:hypothetical protein